MMFFAEMAIGWLGIGSFVAAAVLIGHLRTGSVFPRRTRWWLIPAVTVAWPWPAWVWYSGLDIPIPRTARIGLVTIVLVGVLGSGWVCGLNLYDFLNPKELELADKRAIGAMIERIIDPESTGNTAKNEHLDETRLELIAASPPASGQNGSAKTASRPGTNR